MEARDEHPTSSDRRRQLAPLAVLGVLALLAGPAVTSAAAHGGPDAPSASDEVSTEALEAMVTTGEAPRLASGFYLQPVAPVEDADAIAFGPGDDGPDLYAAPADGAEVARVHLQWTSAGPRAEEVETLDAGAPVLDGVAFGDGCAVEDSADLVPGIERADAGCPAPAAEGPGACEREVAVPRAAALPTGDAFPEPFRSSVFATPCDPGADGVQRLVVSEDGPDHVEAFVEGLEDVRDLEFGPDGALYAVEDRGVVRVGGGQGTTEVRGVTFQFVPEIAVVSNETTMRWTAEFFGHTVTTSDNQCLHPAFTPDGCTPNDENDSDSDPDTFDEDVFTFRDLTHTWRSTGYHPYYCEIHDNLGMVGGVLVTPRVGAS